MKFSLMYDLRVPAELSSEPLADVYNKFLDQAERADELGFDAIWITEHHYSPDDQWISAALPMVAAVAARTKRIEVGTGIIALPLHDPVRVAEAVATIDHISRGRARLGIAIGYRVEEFATDKMPRKERVPRLEEGVELIRRCWTEDDFTFEGDWYSVDKMRFVPKPVQRPHPPIYLAAQAEVSVRRAARLGYHVFPNASRTLYDAYVDELALHGRDVADFEIAAFPDQLFVCEDPDAAWDRWRDCFMYRWKYYDKAYSEGTDLDLLTPEDRERRIRSAILRPEEAVDYLGKLHERVPCTEFVFFAGFPGMPLEESGASLELFAQEVMPHFR
jgi:alkanesulfonate monooxygenase SsuD/methylene tetrahydromethanopterin reductase-like flavin-dependent oxidoreductase (luciferase family)